MKKITEICTLKESVFNSGKNTDVISLSDLIADKINPYDFFDETYITEGMQRLFEIAFDRFSKKDNSSNIVKLTQAMGGGKTHSLVSLGLLAKHKELRRLILGSGLEDIPSVNIVAFNGRNTDSTYGIWGEIANQLGNKDYFNDYYAPLKAPGEDTWIDFLSKTLNGEPLLILLDELPPYFDNAESITIGDSNLARVTATALSNLFVATANPKLSNVLIVLSDLNASYESGSEMLNQSLSVALSTLDKESSRYSENIEPVRSNSNDVFEILKKKFFKKLPSEKEIENIQKKYIRIAKECVDSGYIDSDISCLNNIKESYPFHPSLRDLFATFKENIGFQQTRGLLRIMRDILIDIYSEDNKNNIYLVNLTNINLNNDIGITNIKSINSKFTNAISHDIASNKLSVAEVIDLDNDKMYAQRLSKTILFASMSNSCDSKVGLSQDDVLLYSLEPGDNLLDLNLTLDKLKSRAWYLHENHNNEIMFKNTQNVIAKINDYISSYGDDIAFRQLKEVLEKKFEPKTKKCYQKVQVFPAIDDIKINRNQISLIITKPNFNNELSSEVDEFYNNLEYKNRIIFLTGHKNTTASLLFKVKEIMAISQIQLELIDSDITSSNYQLAKLKELYVKAQFDLLNIINQTFTVLKYPFRSGLKSTDLLLSNTGHINCLSNMLDADVNIDVYDGERNIVNTLLTTKKLELWDNDNLNSLSNEAIIRKFEHRIFTQDKMLKNDIDRRMATLQEWSFLEPTTFDYMVKYQEKQKNWRLKEGYLEKGPFSEKATLRIEVLEYNRLKGEKLLKLYPINADKVFCYSTNNNYGILYEEKIDRIKDEKDFVNIRKILIEEGFKEVNLNEEFAINSLFNYFIALDSSMYNIYSDLVECNIDLNIKYLLQYNKEDNSLKSIKFEPIPKLKGASIRYSTEGFKAVHGKKGTVVNNLELCNVVTAIATVGTMQSRQIRINVQSIREKGYYIDETRETIISKEEKCHSFELIKQELELLQKYNCILNNIELVFNKEKNVRYLSQANMTCSNLIELIDNMVNVLNCNKEDIELIINTKTFENGANFVSYLKSSKKDFEYYKGGITQW